MDYEKFKNAPEIKEVIPKHEIAFAFIKSHAIKDLPEIEKLLKENGLEIIYQDRIKLEGDVIDHIYKEYLDTHFYPVMKDFLEKNEVGVLLVGGPGHHAQEVLLRLKKINGEDGPIRQRFRIPRLDREEYELWEKGDHPNQDEVSVLITLGNVIHTADSTEEALKSLKMILGKKFEEMKKKGNLPAELWEIFSESDSSIENHK
jgi:nucleoside diphosphate kinase